MNGKPVNGASTDSLLAARGAGAPAALAAGVSPRMKGHALQAAGSRSAEQAGKERASDSSGGRPAQVRLKRPVPRYPFSRKSYWAAHLPAPAEQDDFALPGTIPLDFGDEYISEHKIVGNIVVPGATIMMTVLGTLRDVSRRTDLKLREVKFRQALILEREGQRGARLNLTRLDRQSYHFELVHPLNGVVFASGNIAVET